MKIGNKLKELRIQKVRQSQDVPYLADCGEMEETETARIFQMDFRERRGFWAGNAQPWNSGDKRRPGTGLESSRNGQKPDWRAEAAEDRFPQVSAAMAAQGNREKIRS